MNVFAYLDGLAPGPDERSLGQACVACAAVPGQLCERRGGGFHAARIDKGNAAWRKRRQGVLRELEALL